MIIGVEAKFKSESDANQVCSIIKDRFTVKQSQVVTYDNLSEYNSKYRVEKVIKDLGYRVVVGALLGFIIGAILNTFFKIDGYTNSFDNTLFVLFALGGTLTGIMCAVLLFYIKREKVVPVSEEDLSSPGEALVLVQIPQDNLTKVEKLLKKFNAVSVHTI